MGDLLFIEYVERLSMSDCESMPAEVRDRLRSIPAVHELLSEWPVMKAAGDAGDTIVREAIDVELDAERAAIRSGAPASASSPWPSSGGATACRCRPCVPPSTRRAL